jgi:hypothetical protein
MTTRYLVDVEAAAWPLLLGERVMIAQAIRGPMTVAARVAQIGRRSICRVEVAIRALLEHLHDARMETELMRLAPMPACPNDIRS